MGEISTETSALEQVRSELRNGLDGARRVVTRTRFLLSGDEAETADGGQGSVE